MQEIVYEKEKKTMLLKIHAIRAVTPALRSTLETTQQDLETQQDVP